jgi:hypothetical protein
MSGKQLQVLDSSDGKRRKAAFATASAKEKYETLMKLWEDCPRNTKIEDVDQVIYNIIHSYPYECASYMCSTMWTPAQACEFLTKMPGMTPLKAARALQNELRHHWNKSAFPESYVRTMAVQIGISEAGLRDLLETKE